MKIIPLLLLVCLYAGGSTLSYSHRQDGNEARGGTTDTSTNAYFPDGNDFVCINGHNRYTRALYGKCTDYRIETSDRPLFAIYKKGDCRNVSLTITHKGHTLAAENAERCEARYSCGVRTYELCDSSWGKGRLSISVTTLRNGEGAAWEMTADGFDSNVTITAIIRPIANERLQRNGDMGVDPPGSFEPKEGSEPVIIEIPLGERPMFLTTNYDNSADVHHSFSVSDSCPSYDEARNYQDSLSRSIVFSTPDAHINTLGGALAAAADGLWDGQTWLHGCIGWRMPLAGWRAAYVGDALGRSERSRRHFDAYAQSQVTDIEPYIKHPAQDSTLALARAEKRWGTPMYSNGYICRYPARKDRMNHYDMNLCYIDELLWHFCYDADTAYMRRMWPVITSHIAWEKRNFDPDGDGLYDAYCCIWASDALYYSGGGVAHSSAYNYRANTLAAKIARLIGEDAEPYIAEADKILKAMNERLWTGGTSTSGHWAEYVESLGYKRRHDSAALWSIYTPVDCGAGSPQQCYAATLYVDSLIPHIKIEGCEPLSTLSTSNWMPYAWSINNVAAAEVAHTALAFFEAGRPEEAFRLMKANILDQMYLGHSPANFGQLSRYDAARGECYRDFGDCIGIYARTLTQGLFGIVPDALDGSCVIRPGFPVDWDSASVKLPYLSYSFSRADGKDIYEIEQHFTNPLTIVLRQNLGGGRYRDIQGSNETRQTIIVGTPDLTRIKADTAAVWHPQATTEADAAALALAEPPVGQHTKVDIDGYLNADVSDIFMNEYRSPRPQTTTLQIPLQGVGDWCSPTYRPEINDSVFRSMIIDDEFTMAGVPFRTHTVGKNIAYTSQWDNYPDSISIDMSAQEPRAKAACLLLAGSTNHMQSRIDNGLAVAHYDDGTTDTLRLINPDNWCPIEQDYYIDGKAFSAAQPRPYRVCLGTGDVSRDLGDIFNITKAQGRELKGGAAQMLTMPLNADKTLTSLMVKPLSCDIVIGLMAVTLIQ